jgi:hypothetical protein
MYEKCNCKVKLCANSKMARGVATWLSNRKVLKHDAFVLEAGGWWKKEGHGEQCHDQHGTLLVTLELFQSDLTLQLTHLRGGGWQGRSEKVCVNKAAIGVTTGQS